MCAGDISPCCKNRVTRFHPTISRSADTSMSQWSIFVTYIIYANNSELQKKRRRRRTEYKQKVHEEYWCIVITNVDVRLIRRVTYLGSGQVNPHGTVDKWLNISRFLVALARLYERIRRRKSLYLSLTEENLDRVGHASSKRPIIDPFSRIVGWGQFCFPQFYSLKKSDTSLRE